jgi:hypothetical protein
VDQCQSVDLKASCEGCTTFESLGLRCDGWTRSMLLAGDRVLLSRLRSLNPERVDLLAVRGGPSVLWRHDLGYNELPDLSSDGQLATLSTWHSLDSTLHIWSEGMSFEERTFELDAAPSGFRVAGDRLHLLVPQPAGLRYLAGPLTGPLELVEELASNVSLLDLDPVKLLHSEASGGGTLLWTEYAGIRHELAVPTPTGWSVLDTPEGLVGMQHWQYAGLDLRTASQAWHLGTDTVPAPCSGFEVVNYPYLCPSAELAQGQRAEVVLSARLVADDAGVPWVAAIVGNLTETCVWSGFCFETLPCNCRQVLAVATNAAELRLQRLSDSVHAVRVGLGSFGSTHPLLAIRFHEGQFVVTIGDAGSYQTLLYWFVIQPE